MKVPKKQTWLILVMAGVFYLYEYVLRVSPQVLMHHLMGKYSLDSTSFGFMSAFYYIAYVPLQTPCGYILDRLGVRFVITASTLLCTSGAIIFTYTDQLIIAYIGRFLMGMGSACAYVSCMKVGADWFESKMFPLIAGITLMMGQLGAAVGTHPFSFLVFLLGYFKAMNVLILLGGIIAFLAYKIIPSKPMVERPKPLNILDSFKVVLRSKINWVLGLYGLFMYVGISGFAELWAIPFFMQKINASCYSVATLPIFFFIGVGVGSPIISNIAKKINLPHLTMAMLGLLGALLFYIIVYVNIGFIVSSALLFFMGALCGGHVLCFVIAKENTPLELSGTTLGFLNMIVMTSGLIFQPLIGFLLDQNWTGLYDSKGIKSYSLQNFEYAMFVILLTYVASFLLISFYFRKEIKQELMNKIL
ncbi:MAG: MFS transporter [Proteobacteria bacterium]|nr:MFS transporter [Pseudomonadota bacterium]